MSKILTFLLAPILLMAMGCTIQSKNMVGLQDFKLDPQQIDGTWINSDGAVSLKVMDGDKGIVRVVVLENKEKPEIYNFKIMKGKSWLYFNLLPEKNSPEEMFYWGKVKIDENRIIAWHPSEKPFIKAIAEGKILGTIKPEAITDSAKNIVDLVESSENAFFQWEEPMFFIKLAK
jgi:hypothetical protein